MAERRSLTEGLKATPKVDPSVAREFIYGKETAEAGQGASTLALAPTRTAVITRTTFSTRLRADLAKALKRASLERKLQGLEPNNVQDILEQALEPWLEANGYLT